VTKRTRAGRRLTAGQITWEAPLRLVWRSVPSMSDVLEVVAAGVVGYVVGTFPSADVVTRAVTRGQVDIRSTGSGNPGGFNAIRVVGRTWGVVVIVLDAAKGALAGLLGMLIAGDAGAYVGATAAIVGHCFPVWARFRGGKGVATAGGSMGTVFPPMMVIAGLTAIAGSVLTKSSERAMWVTCSVWVAGAVVWAVADLPNAWGPEPDAGLAIYAVLGAALILGKFRAAARAGVPAQ
jgi:glycerol-3-phosphate acyltransferase PlsY